MSWDSKLEDETFKYVIIDDATLAIEPDCLLPILKGAEKLVLTGD